MSLSNPEKWQMPHLVCMQYVNAEIVHLNEIYKNDVKVGKVLNA